MTAVMTWEEIRSKWFASTFSHICHTERDLSHYIALLSSIVPTVAVVTRHQRKASTNKVINKLRHQTHTQRSKTYLITRAKKGTPEYSENYVSFSHDPLLRAVLSTHICPSPTWCVGTSLTGSCKSACSSSRLMSFRKRTWTMMRYFQSTTCNRSYYSQCLGLARYNLLFHLLINNLVS